MIVDQDDFNPLIGEVWHTCLLPPKQMKEIYNMGPRRELFVVGLQWCERAEVVKILLGNHATITVPKSMFPEHLPLDQPWIEDYGIEIYFGPYEVDLKDILFI